MAVQRTVIMRRIVDVSATLTEQEVHRAIVEFVLRTVAPDLLVPFAELDRRLTFEVDIDEFSATEVRVTHEQDVEVAP